MSDPAMSPSLSGTERLWVMETLGGEVVRTVDEGARDEPEDIDLVGEKL